MTTQTPAAARTYLARVRTALADLPSTEIEEIVEDVRPQLVEITEEAGENVRLETLIERLGTPESYAAELRAAGDYPPPSAAEAPAVKRSERKLATRFVFWLAMAGLVVIALTALAAGESLHAELLVMAVVGAVPLAFAAWYAHKRGGMSVFASLPEVGAARSLAGPGHGGKRDQAWTYLRSLRPAWWLICAAVLLVLGLLLTVRDTEWILIFPVFLVGAALIVWAGPRSSEDRRLVWLTVPLSLLVVGSGIGMASNVFQQVDDRYSSGANYANAGSYTGENELHYGNQSVENVYAFDAEGKPLTEFYLYDEQGRPLTINRHGCDPSTGTRTTVGEDNKFPRPQIKQGGYDGQGNYNGYNAYRASCELLDGVPFSAALPKPAKPATPADPAQNTPAPVPAPGGPNGSEQPAPPAASTPAPAPAPAPAPGPSTQAPAPPAP